VFACLDPQRLTKFLKMGKQHQKLNPKYVALLRETYKKYSQINYVNLTPPNPNVESSKSSKITAKESKDSDSTPENLIVKPITKIRPEGKKTEENTGVKRSYYSKANNGRKLFSKQEDAFLLEYLKKHPDFDQNKTAQLHVLMKIMKRTLKSIYNRIITLQKGIKTTRRNRQFALMEDKLIIDEAVKHLHKTKSLRETVILDPREFCKKFNRNFQAVEQRWSITLRSWLLQYYNKNLNLEIRPMLSDLLQRNFDSIKSINWNFVASHEVFSGHTEISLRHVFYSKTLFYTSNYLKKPTYDVSLEEIADYSRTHFLNSNIKLAPKVEKRQLDCISYFEEQTKKLGITRFKF